MWRLGAATVAAALGVAALGAVEPEPGDVVAAAEEEDGACDANCAVSLRQLRAAQSDGSSLHLAAEAAAEGKVDDAHRKDTAKLGKATLTDERADEAQPLVELQEAAVEALERRATDPGVRAKLTSLLETFSGKSGGSVTVYHQTSPEIAAVIMKTGFQPGNHGWCGGAIYFAQSSKDTFHKAIGSDSHKGVILSARVDLGKLCHMGRWCDRSMNAAKLEAKGCNSMEFNPGDGNEFVVYDPGRVHNIHPIWTASRSHAMALHSELSGHDGGSSGPDEASDALGADLPKELEATIEADVVH